MNGVTLFFSVFQTHLEGLLKQVTGPIPSVSEAVDPKLGLRICMSIKFPGDFDEASLGSTLQELLCCIILGPSFIALTIPKSLILWLTSMLAYRLFLNRKYTFEPAIEKPKERFGIDSYLALTVSHLIQNVNALRARKCLWIIADCSVDYRIRVGSFRKMYLMSCYLISLVMMRGKFH